MTVPELPADPWAQYEAELNAAVRTIESDVTGGAAAVAARFAALDQRIVDLTSNLLGGIASVALASEVRDAELSARVAALEPVVVPPRRTFPGQAAVGRPHWGASITGNTDPQAKYENAAGVPVGIRRTFQPSASASNVTSLVNIATADVAAGRIPWVSIKTLGWATTASGAQDAWIDSILTRLAPLAGPVWLTIHHEPEGGEGVNSPDDPAGPAGHLAANRRVRERMTALGTTNIALAPIFMASTWEASYGRNIEDWWGPDVYDFLGIDIYAKNPTTALDDARFQTIRQWAQGKGVELAVGEWNVLGANEADAIAKMQAFYDRGVASATDGQGAIVNGFACYDSTNSFVVSGVTYTWELKGAKLTRFIDILRGSR
jgi:hypothetical protein